MDIDFRKSSDGLVPAIVQDINTRQVLMLGYMNAEALDSTQNSGKVTFYSRSRQRLWLKGETSGNLLLVENILKDCDSDAILIKARPMGPVCHNGTDTCFGERNEHDDFLFTLEQIITNRRTNLQAGSYTSMLFAEGINKIAQKVGEEAVELIIEAKESDAERFRSEAADLLYHLLVLFVEKGVRLHDVMNVLQERCEYKDE